MSQSNRRQQLTLELIASVLDQLDAEDSSADFAARRTSPRASHRVAGVSFEVEHIGGGISSYTGCSRNLSQRGMSLIVDVFVHPGSTVEVSLRRLDGGTERLTGRIVQCRHVSGRLHELGIFFSKAIFPPSFTSDANGMSVSSGGDDLVGRILCYTPRQTSLQILSTFLRATQVEVVHCDTLGKAKDRLKLDLFDAVIVDAMADDDIVEACAAFKDDCQCPGHIILITADDQMAYRAGNSRVIDQVVRMPLSKASVRAALIEAFSHFRQSVPLGVYAESSCADPDLFPIINTFVKDARR